MRTREAQEVPFLRRTASMNESQAKESHCRTASEVAELRQSKFEDYICIGGIEMPLDGLLRVDISDPDFRTALRDQFTNAKPSSI